jgi:hypothetical protein
MSEPTKPVEDAVTLGAETETDVPEFAERTDAFGSPQGVVCTGNIIRRRGRTLRCRVETEVERLILAVENFQHTDIRKGSIHLRADLPKNSLLLLEF